MFRFFFLILYFNGGLHLFMNKLFFFDFEMKILKSVVGLWKHLLLFFNYLIKIFLFFFIFVFDHWHLVFFSAILQLFSLMPANTCWISLSMMNNAMVSIYSFVIKNSLSSSRIFLFWKSL